MGFLFFKCIIIWFRCVTHLHGIGKKNLFKNVSVDVFPQILLYREQGTRSAVSIVNIYLQT